MTRFRWERELIDPVSLYLRRRGFREIGNEVPFYEYKIDLYGYSPKASLSIALELKLTNWRKALHQTLIYQLTADWVFAAFPAYTVKKDVISQFSEVGVGLISVNIDGSCRQILKPQPSTNVRDWYRSHLVSFITTDESCQTSSPRFS